MSVFSRYINVSEISKIKITEQNYFLLLKANAIGNFLIKIYSESDLFSSSYLRRADTAIKSGGITAS